MVHGTWCRVYAAGTVVTSLCCETRTSSGTSDFFVQPPRGESQSTGFLKPLLISLRRAKNAPDFVEFFEAQNTGTLMAQWMVVDYNMFQPGRPIGQNLLWVIEQIPGHQEAKDMSLVLAQRPKLYSVSKKYNEDSWRHLRSNGGRNAGIFPGPNSRWGDSHWTRSIGAARRAQPHTGGRRDVFGR